LSGVLRTFFWMAYDHLGGLVLLNLLWTALNLPWMAAGWLIFRAGLPLGKGGALAGMLLGLEAVLLAPPTVLLFAAGACWAGGRERGTRELLAQARRLLGRAQALQLLIGGATGVLVVNLLFYQTLAGWLGLVLSGTMLWLLLGLALVVVHLFPVLVTQETGVWQTLRQSFLLAMDNVRLSLALLLAWAVALVAGLFTGIGLFCGVLASLALFSSLCFGALLARYTGHKLPQEPPRRWRELIRPWEG
jgi:uncharacterized membrane protein YesL